MTAIAHEPAGARPRRLRLTRASGWGGLDAVAVVLVVLLCLVALAAPLLAGHDPTARTGEAFLAPGSPGHLLGTDDGGRDMASRLLYGMRSTWLSVLALLAVSMLIGAVVGTLAGAFGGWLDGLLMRITDVFLALPGPLLAIAISAALGRSLLTTLVAITVVWWPWYARIVRNEVRALRARPHMEAARLSRVGRMRSAIRYLFPGAVPPLVVASSTDAGALVGTLAALSFFGLGATPPAPELGGMTASGSVYLADYWWLAVLPAMAVLVVALIAMLAGDAARAAFEDR